MDILLLQETFLKIRDDAKIRELQDHGIGFMSCPRTTGRERGGLAILYNPALKVKVNTKAESYKSFEHMEATLQTEEELLRFIDFYRPPYSKGHRYTEKDFVLELDDNLEHLITQPGVPIIAGDFNMHVEDSENRYANVFKMSLEEVNLVQHVPMIPTHRRGGTLDLIITPEDVKDLVTGVQVLDHGTESDHFLVEAEISFTPLYESAFKEISFRKFKDIDIEMFKADLKKTGINDGTFNSSDDAIQALDSTLQKLMDKHCPITKKRVKCHGKRSSWYDEELERLKQTRRRAERAWCKSRDPADKLEYNVARVTHEKMVKLRRVAHHSSKLIKATGSKQLWNMINDLLGKVDNKLPDHQDAEALAESFKVFFNDKVGKIRESIIKEQESALDVQEKCVQFCESEHECSLEYVEDLLVEIDYNKGQGCAQEECVQLLSDQLCNEGQECAQEDVIRSDQCGEDGLECTLGEEEDQYNGIIFDEFQLITEEMLLKFMKSMSQKFCALDPIPVWLLVECFDELKTVILFIVNSSLENGKFPTRCKVALVRPTIKSKSADPDNLASFRPVSNISFLSKLLEKVGATQFNLHLEGQNLHCPVQSGYRPRHSCETLMIKMMNDILHLIEEKNTVALILLDLSAAFDTIDHDILLKRLESDFGIKGVVLEWFRSYLKERSFTVLIGDKSSSKGYLWFGVPQGSILGPILFILYTKALQRIAKKYGILIQLYADDSQLYIGFRANDPLSVGDAVRRIEECLREIKEWMRDNFMKLNNSKTELILLGTVQMLKKVGPLQADVGDSVALMSSQEAVTSLGVKLDENLNLKKQIAKVKQAGFLIEILILETVHEEAMIIFFFRSLSTTTLNLV